MLQLSLSVIAASISWAIFKRQHANQNSDLKIKLYDKRINVYYAFKEITEWCSVNEEYDREILNKFMKACQDVEFLFGDEVRRYKKEIVANAIAMDCISKNIPCVDKPVVGSVLGFFPGSSTFSTIQELQAWFIRQHQRDLFLFFAPYLNYGQAGVQNGDIKMKPKELPDPPYIVRRKRSQRPNKTSKP